MGDELSGRDLDVALSLAIGWEWAALSRYWSTDASLLPELLNELANRGISLVMVSPNRGTGFNRSPFEAYRHGWPDGREVFQADTLTLAVARAALAALRTVKSAAPLEDDGK